MIRGKYLAPTRTGSRRFQWGRLVNRSSWLYAASLLAFLLVLHWGGDRWWLATVLMFSPRWLFGFPLVALLPATLIVDRKALWPLALSLALIIGPIMGLCVPWRLLATPLPSGPSFRVLTCNVHYDKLNASALSRLISDIDPDIIALQGCLEGHQVLLSREQKWNTRLDGELCLGSRYPILKVEKVYDPIFEGGRGSLACYELDAPGGTIHFFNLHLASPRPGLRAVLNRPREIAALIQADSDLRHRQANLVQHRIKDAGGGVLVAGDFNTPPESTLYIEYWSSFDNGFDEAGFGWGYTFFRRGFTVRIDHQLAGPGWRCRRCWVGPSVGSPHRPLIADWVRNDTPD